MTITLKSSDIIVGYFLESTNTCFYLELLKFLTSEIIIIKATIKPDVKLFLIAAIFRN